MFLTEAYYGKNKYLEEVEGYLKLMKEDLLKGINPNKSKNKIKIERIFENLFGFEKVHFSIIASEDGFNAYTMPYFYDTNKKYDDEFFKIVKDHTGIKYKNPKGKILYMYTYNYGIRNVDPEILVGVLLHEIGHNFYTNKYSINNCKSRLAMSIILYALEVIKMYNFDVGVVKEVFCFLLYYAKQFATGIAKSHHEEVKRQLSDAAQKAAMDNHKFWTDHIVLNTIITVLKNIVSRLLTSGFHIILLIFLPVIIMTKVSNLKKVLKTGGKENDIAKGYENEKYADNFAISYGYGSSMAKAFNGNMVWDREDSILNNVPILNIINYYERSLMLFIFAFEDPHPDSIRRVVFSLKKLEFELEKNKDSLDSRQKEEIQTQIDEIRKLLKDVPLYKRAINGIFSGFYDDKDEEIHKHLGRDETVVFDHENGINKDNMEKSKRLNESIDHLFNIEEQVKLIDSIYEINQQKQD